LKIIIDFDGTLTAEEAQVKALADKSLDTLANEIINVPREELAADYQATRARLMRTPHQYWWEVNGLIASYCNEGAFILNTTTLQVMLRDDARYQQAVTAAFPRGEYSPVILCINYLFHRHTAELTPAFRPAARDVLASLIENPRYTPIILTNSLGNKVTRHLATLKLDEEIAVLGDTRQYEMDPEWKHHFPHPELGQIQVWPVTEQYRVDLRRTAYYGALVCAAKDGSSLAVVADTFSLPGALPLLMGIPFFLLRTSYTPAWCAQVVGSHPLGYILEDLADLPVALSAISAEG